MRTISRTLAGEALFAAALAIAVPAPANAADLTPNYRYYTAPAPYYAFSWVGPYIGATAGYEWGNVGNNPTRPAGFTGGVEAGWSWQNGSFVYGGETDLNPSGAKDTFALWQFSNPWFGTVRGRVGIAINNVLLFGTAGLGYGELTAWVVGSGAEISFTPHWSTKAEWLYLDLADQSFSATGANNGLAANLVRLGLNYHF